MADKNPVAQTPEEVEAAKQYVNDDENRKLAFTKALELLRIFRPDGFERDMLTQIPFTRTEMVKKTTLSHRTALQLLETLRSFGYVTFLDSNKTKFYFSFSPDDRAAVQKAKIIQLTQVLGTAVEGYVTLLRNMYPDDVYQRELVSMEDYLSKALKVKS